MIVGLDPDVMAALNQPHVSALYALKLDLVSGIAAFTPVSVSW